MLDIGDCEKFLEMDDLGALRHLSREMRKQQKGPKGEDLVQQNQGRANKDDKSKAKENDDWIDQNQGNIGSLLDEENTKFIKAVFEEEGKSHQSQYSLGISYQCADHM
jgi:hypothetical protein